MHKHLQQCKGKLFQASLVGSTLVANFWIFRNFVSKKNGVVSALMMSKRFHCQRCQFCLLFHWLWHCGESLKSSTLRPQKGSNYTYERTLDLINPLIELLLRWLDSLWFVIVSFLMLLINFSMQAGNNLSIVEVNYQRGTLDDLLCLVTKAPL